MSLLTHKEYTNKTLTDLIDICDLLKREINDLHLCTEKIPNTLGSLQESWKQMESSTKQEIIELEKHIEALLCEYKERLDRLIARN